MPCSKCDHIIDRRDIFHCIRTCDGCGRTMYVHEPGEHGLGVRIREGDRPVVPASLLKLAANPLKSPGRLSKGGLEWFAKLIFIEDLPSKRNELPDAIKGMRKQSDDLLENSELLAALDLNDETQAAQAIDILAS